jgi:hypothetical protein
MMRCSHSAVNNGVRETGEGEIGKHTPPPHTSRPFVTSAGLTSHALPSTMAVAGSGELTTLVISGSSTQAEATRAQENYHTGGCLALQERSSRRRDKDSEEEH